MACMSAQPPTSRRKSSKTLKASSVLGTQRHKSREICAFCTITGTLSRQLSSFHTRWTSRSADSSLTILSMMLRLKSWASKTQEAMSSQWTPRINRTMKLINFTSLSKQPVRRLLSCSSRRSWIAGSPRGTITQIIDQRLANCANSWKRRRLSSSTILSRRSSVASCSRRRVRSLNRSLPHLPLWKNAQRKSK